MFDFLSQYDFWHSAIMFIVVLSILVFVHELGHYLAARSVGAKIKTFSIGFGREVFGFTRKNGERWRLSLIPLGGYVDIFGMDKDSEDVKDLTSDKDLEGALYKKNVWARIWVVFAGPFANFVFAIVALTGLYYAEGIRETSSRVGSVMQNMPAEKAGLQAGDLIKSINGQEVTKWHELSELIGKSESTEPLNFVIQRDDKTFNVTIAPEEKEIETILQEKVNRRLIGINISSDFVYAEETTFVQALEQGFITTYNITTLIITSVKRMITGEMKADVGGPLTIAEQSGEAAKSGLYALVMFMVMISINLGVLNLLPIPVLDGGHLVYYFIEVLTFGRGLHDKIKAAANYTGLFVLISLMVFAFYKDISRIFF
jgi:regulator of sigma E protease